MIGELAGLGCAALWATVSIVMRALSERLSPVAVNGLRCSFATLTLAALVVGLGQTGSFAALPLGGVAAVLAGGMMGQGAGAAKTSILSSTSPLFGLPLSLLFLREKIDARILGGTLFSVVGIRLVLSA